ncbi:MAG: cyclic pyranopterin monophosphate synthase MoaC [archaeon GB-1867-097]|nr:cyclic pyranopterin monophosphate synthase MoaC [Candidatus Culexmicrobium thermophilum]MCS7384899.1 cyclic pyranopterin monophosphate synthase MoaC [Candidatus Culexmicrobium thermophilum]RLE57015.1 MAG: cyclic pyranopterin monophosphate synthase MoaC [Candidatus Verstraetearchaeota archaeon]
MEDIVKMVDISRKEDQLRIAVASGRIKLKPETIKKIVRGEIEKGNVIAVAKIAGIMAAKRTATLIPLCHPIPITNVKININVEDEYVEVKATVKAKAKTGVEIEALTATATTLITIWDMVKKYEKDVQGRYPETEIEKIKVELKLKE